MVGLKICVPATLVILYWLWQDTARSAVPPAAEFTEVNADHAPPVVSASAVTATFISAERLPITRSPELAEAEVTVGAKLDPEAVAAAPRRAFWNPVNE